MQNRHYRVKFCHESRAEYGIALHSDVFETCMTMEQLEEKGVYGLDRIRAVRGVNCLIVCDMLNGKRAVIQYGGYDGRRGMFNVVVQYTDEERETLCKVENTFSKEGVA